MAESVVVDVSAPLHDDHRYAEGPDFCRFVRDSDTSLGWGVPFSGAAHDELVVNFRRDRFFSSLGMCDSRDHARILLIRISSTGLAAGPGSPMTRGALGVSRARDLHRRILAQVSSGCCQNVTQWHGSSGII